MVDAALVSAGALVAIAQALKEAMASGDERAARREACLGIFVAEDERMRAEMDESLATAAS
jgi:hypothetical protein